METTIARLAVLLVAGAFALIHAQDFIFPPYDESHKHVSGSKPVTQRLPLKSPVCKENMLLYPDDGPKSAWVCDCIQGYVYFPKNDTCHKPFYRGPCPEHHYVYLPLNESIPGCVDNPCKINGIVPYNGGCYKVNARAGPCKGNEALQVNETTYQLECVNQFIVPEIIIDAPPRSCPKGSRRNNLGTCKPVL